MIPNAASHSSGDATGRKPTRSATAMTTPVASRLRTRLATTWPVSTAPLRIGMVRNRSMMPVVMSRETAMAVDDAPNPAQSRMMPGTT
jgi:hypothetical protein